MMVYSLVWQVGSSARAVGSRGGECLSSLLYGFPVGLLGAPHEMEAGFQEGMFQETGSRSCLSFKA